MYINQYLTNPLILLRSGSGNHKISDITPHSDITPPSPPLVWHQPCPTPWAQWWRHTAPPAGWYGPRCTRHAYSLYHRVTVGKLTLQSTQGNTSAVHSRYISLDCLLGWIPCTGMVSNCMCNIYLLTRCLCWGVEDWYGPSHPNTTWARQTCIVWGSRTSVWQYCGP